MFQGFQNAGSTTMIVRPKNMFNGFEENSTFGQVVTGIGGVVTDNLLAWFNPSVNVTLNNGNVSKWQDTTGTYTLSQSTAVNQPAYVTSYSGNYLSFNGSTSIIGNPAFNLGVGTNKAFTVIAICQVLNFSSGFAFTAAYNPAAVIPGRYDVGRINGGTWQYIWIDSTFSNIISGPSQTTPVSYNAGVFLNAIEINRGLGRMLGHFGGTYQVVSAACSTTIVNYNGLPFNLGGDSS